MLNNTNSSTYRDSVLLPAMPDEKDIKFIEMPEVEMPESYIKNGELFFNNLNGYSEAIRLGFFLLKIPEDVDVSSGDFFVKNFYKDKNKSTDLYNGYKNVIIEESYQGYFDRKNDQWENFYIESKNWDKHLPKELTLLGNKMVDTGISILESFFNYLKIPPVFWEQLTSNLINKKGHQMFAFNHFRPEKLVRGSKFHRDSGWVTILRSFDPGLIALIEGDLYKINPKPGFWIVNFGSTFEVLTRKIPTPVRANIHGVVKTNKKNNSHDRVSYTMFFDSNLDGTIYELDKDLKPYPIQSVIDFAAQEVNRTYDESNDLL